MYDCWLKLPVTVIMPILHYFQLIQPVKVNLMAVPLHLLPKPIAQVV